MDKDNWVSIRHAKDLPEGLSATTVDGNFKSVIFELNGVPIRISGEWSSLNIAIPEPPKTITVYAVRGELPILGMYEKYFDTMHEAHRHRDKICMTYVNSPNLEVVDEQVVEGSVEVCDVA